jgi:DNA-binding PadR family transcriptional regulator
MPDQVHSEYELLLLGLLRKHAMHGYQLMETIQKAMTTCVSIKKPTVYFFLKRMEKAGWVTSQAEKTGNHPPKNVYQITLAGETVYQQMLRENLTSTFLVQHPGDIGLIFSDDLPDQDVISAVKLRLDNLKTEIERVRSAPAHSGRIQWMLDHQITTLQNELDWHQSLLARLNRKPDQNLLSPN